MQILIVYGCSGSGKTYYIENDIIGGLPLEETRIKDIDVTVCKERGLLLFGKYLVDKRCKGCDTLSMSVISPLLDCLKHLIEQGEYALIVADGDRVNNDKMFKFLSKHREKVEIVYVDTPLDLIYKRLPGCNKTFVQTTYTKTKHTIQKCYALGFKIRHVKTERSPFLPR
jgi:predicted kinase